MARKNKYILLCKHHNTIPNSFRDNTKNGLQLERIMASIQLVKNELPKSSKSEGQRKIAPEIA